MKIPFTYISSLRYLNKFKSSNKVSRFISNIPINIRKRIILGKFMKSKIITKDIVEDYIRAVRYNPKFSIYDGDVKILDIKLMISNIEFIQDGDSIEFEDLRENSYERIILKLTYSGIDFIWDRSNIRFLFSYPTVASKHEFEQVSKLIIKYMVDSFDYLDRRGDLI